METSNSAVKVSQITPDQFLNKHLNAAAEHFAFEQSLHAHNWRELFKKGLDPSVLSRAANSAIQFRDTQEYSRKVLKFFRELYRAIDEQKSDTITAITSVTETMRRESDGRAVGKILTPRAFIYKSIRNEDIVYDGSNGIGNSVSIHAPHLQLSMNILPETRAADNLLLVQEGTNGILHRSQHWMAGNYDSFEGLGQDAGLFMEYLGFNQVISPGSPSSVFASRIAIWAETRSHEFDELPHRYFPDL